ncbi:hypothetical protein NECAME_01349 [Necator americanus]|uniref:NAD-dependent epimerase/dehydratase domain-containing protein n=1 Tax=Necator americanus TaxID=51031 RepID=W2TYT8_NECAM|nr:hypothetical protein NECAME_01349 [Necator americanus]ETN86221.1 hypothetical protein NECAME_01349 [Necator americanus]
MLSDCENGSATIIGRMMDFRTYLASPKVSLGVVDVRDVAKAHIEAMTRKETDGERILISARSMWFKNMLYWLRREFTKMVVLVTGASGYVALHCVQQLLDAGYSVRGTVRSKNNTQALTRKETDGERILISARSVWFKDMARWLRKEFKKMGYSITHSEAPNWILKLYNALKIDIHVAAVVHRVGPELQFDNTKSRELLGLTYMDVRKSLIEMVHSMIQYGMIRKTSGYEKWMKKEKKKMTMVTNRAQS